MDLSGSNGHVSHLKGKVYAVAPNKAAMRSLHLTILQKKNMTIAFTSAQNLHNR